MWKCWIKQFWAAQGASSTDWGYLIVCLYMQTQLAVLWAPCISFLTILWMTRISFILIYSWYQAGVFSVMWSQKTLEHCNTTSSPPLPPPRPRNNTAPTQHPRYCITGKYYHMFIRFQFPVENIQHSSIASDILTTNIMDNVSGTKQIRDKGKGEGQVQLKLLQNY